MILLYCIKNIDEPWKQECLGSFKSPDELLKTIGFTVNQVGFLLSAAADAKDDKMPEKLLKLGGKRYWVEFDDSYLINLGVSLIVHDRDDLTQKEIAAILGITQQTVMEIMKNAITKLGRNDKIKSLRKECYTSS